MKKRFFAMLLCIIAVMTLCVFPVTVSAEEVSAETSETVETETPTVDEPVVETPAPEPETPLPEAPEEPEMKPYVAVDGITLTTYDVSVDVGSKIMPIVTMSPSETCIFCVCSNIVSSCET